MARVVIEPYDPAWSATFDSLRRRLVPVLGSVALAIEHVGSTAVPGLAAKPIIDIDIVVRDADGLAVAIARLGTVGYTHRGDQGVAGREAFARPEGDPPHHLYVCMAGGQELLRHLAFRDRLRVDPGAALAYGALKLRLAALHAEDRIAYNDGKGPWIRALMHDPG